MNTQKKEFRFQAQLRKAKEGRKLGGYAARFNERSLDLGGFVEQLLPGCFSAWPASVPPFMRNPFPVERMPWPLTSAVIIRRL